MMKAGVVRTLAGQVSLPLQPGTRQYGDAFEHFIILQCRQLAAYSHREWRFSFLRTKDDAEVDLVVERPGLPVLFIEIKSTTHVQSAQLQSLKKLSMDFGACEPVCFSCDPWPKVMDGIRVLPWAEGIRSYFSCCP